MILTYGCHLLYLVQILSCRQEIQAVKAEHSQIITEHKHKLQAMHETAKSHEQALSDKDSRNATYAHDSARVEADMHAFRAVGCRHRCMPWYIFGCQEAALTRCC